MITFSGTALRPELRLRKTLLLRKLLHICLVAMSACKSKCIYAATASVITVIVMLLLTPVVAKMGGEAIITRKANYYQHNMKFLFYFPVFVLLFLSCERTSLTALQTKYGK